MATNRSKANLICLAIVERTSRYHRLVRVGLIIVALGLLVTLTKLGW